MKIISWNVNGLRAIIKKDFSGFLKKEKPDVLCLQEIKIDSEAIKLAKFDFPGYEEYYNPAERKGYSGTAILVKSSKVKSNKVQLEKKLVWDDEGRIQILDMGKIIFIPDSAQNISFLL